MLKIKDNVNLKELEKFGFDEDNVWYLKMICDGRRGQAFFLEVNKNDRFIYGYSNGADGDGEDAKVDDTIYDLIISGIVEKVSEYQ